MCVEVRECGVEEVEEEEGVEPVAKETLQFFKYNYIIIIEGFAILTLVQNLQFLDM